MNVQFDRLVEMIEKQQAGHEGKPRFAVGEQLKGMAREDSRIVDLLIADLDKKELSLEAAEKMLGNYAAKHRGGANVFCITPLTADKLLREMYGLPEKKVAASADTPSNVIDLDSFF